MFVQECLVFLRGEENFSATPCRNFSFAMRLEGCKDFLNLSMIFQGTAKGYCSAHFLQLQMQMQIFSALHSVSLVVGKLLFKWSRM